MRKAGSGALGCMLGVVVCLQAPQTLCAQEAHVVRGVVRDSASGEPLPNVLVEVVGTEIRTGTSGSGDFELTNVRAGRLSIRFSRIGYATMTVGVVAPTDSILVIPLPVRPIELTPLEVRIESVRDILRKRSRGVQSMARIADTEMLRRFDHLEDPAWFFQELNVSVFHCDGCFVVRGRLSRGASVYIDDRQTVWDELRLIPVRELCHLTVLTPPRSRGIRINAYTCSFLLGVARGEINFAPMMPRWWAW